MKPANKKQLLGRIPVSSIFSTWSIAFAGPPPRTSNGKQYLVNEVEHTDMWAIVRAIRPSLFNPNDVIKFVKDEIIKPFEYDELILSDGDLKFGSMAKKDLAKKSGIECKNTATYDQKLSEKPRDPLNVS